MKKLGQKLLSLALTCALVITMMPMAGLEAFAANGLEVIARHESGGWLCFETKVAK